MTHLLQTTIAGSLPKPAWLAQPNALWAPWRLDGDTLSEGIRDAIRLAVLDQEQAGIDIVSDGEQARRHFVTTFIESLEGVDFEHRKSVRIRNRYDADVPMVVGPVTRRGPIFVDAAATLRAATRRRIKFTLPGPMTMVDTLYDAHYRNRQRLAWAFAEILNDEAHALQAAGVDVIQFDEPAFNVYFDEVREWGVATLERAALGPRLHHRRAYLLRLRDQSEHRMEEDAGHRMAAIRTDFPAARAFGDRPGIARMRKLARADRVDRAARCEGCACRSGRCRYRKDRDAGGGRRDAALGAQVRTGGSPVTRAPTAGWSRFPATVARGKLDALAAGAALVRRLSLPRQALSGPGRDGPRREYQASTKTAGAVAYKCVSSAECFGFKAVSTPCTTSTVVPRRPFLEIETCSRARPNFFFVREVILQWQLVR